MLRQTTVVDVALVRRSNLHVTTTENSTVNLVLNKSHWAIDLAVEDQLLLNKDEVHVYIVSFTSEKEQSFSS